MNFFGLLHLKSIYLFRPDRIISPTPWLSESSILPAIRVTAIVMAAHQFQVLRYRLQLALIRPGSAGGTGPSHAVRATVRLAAARVTAVRLDQLTDVGDVKSHTIVRFPETEILYWFFLLTCKLNWRNILIIEEKK